MGRAPGDRAGPEEVDGAAEVWDVNEVDGGGKASRVDLARLCDPLLSLLVASEPYEGELKCCVRACPETEEEAGEEDAAAA